MEQMEQMESSGFTYIGSYKTASHWEVLRQGVKIKIQSAEDLWNGALMYFKWCDDNPIIKKDVLRAGQQAGRIIHLESPRPYILEALCLRLGISPDYIYDCTKSKNQDDFFFVARNILSIIYTQKLEYALVNVFNPIVAGKVLGLNDIPKEERGSMMINIEVVGNAPALLNNEADIDNEKQIEKYEITNISNDSDDIEKTIS